MRVLEVGNVNEAWPQALAMLDEEGEPEDSRAGRVVVFPDPVTTVYASPQERVLFCPVRDANPFFHLFEAMWMLSGTSDARWLDTYVHDFSARFAEPSGFVHGAYGYRWRHNFYVRDHAGVLTRDQLAAVSSLLRADPATRQAVLAMWSPERDLCMGHVRDKPCNTHAYFRVRGDLLEMTVLCRSNDIVWGCYGANYVHMSVLQEYVAAMSGLRQGMMWQVSNNWHGYVDVLARYDQDRVFEAYYDRGAHVYGGEVSPSLLFLEASAASVQEEILSWMHRPTTYTSQHNPQLFNQLLTPMALAHRMHKNGNSEGALQALELVRHSDWQLAAREWIQRRADRREQT